MQTVFSNDMVAHVWAQQRQPSGRSNNGNFYFEGRTLYSYGTHYPVGIFAGVGGPVFLNSSKSSITTEGKHKGPARAAVRHIAERFYMPELDEIADMIGRAASNGGRLPASAPEHHKRNAESYLAKHWAAIDAESAGAAWILRAIGSRATWPAMRARYEAAAQAKARTNAARLKASNVRAGRELAARPWPIMKAEAWQGATDYRQRGLVELIKDLRDARLATPKAHKRLRAELFRRESALRAIAALARDDADRYGNPGDRTKGRALLHRLRRFKAGALGHVPGYEGPDGPEKLAAALALPTGAGWRMLADMLRDIEPFIPCPPAMWAKATALREMANGIATEREGEEKQRRDIAEARRRVRDGLRTFNRGRRHYRALVASGVWDGAPVDDGIMTGERMNDRARARVLDSIIHHVPAAEPWGAERGLELCPALAERARRIAAKADAIAESLAPVRAELLTAWEREQEAARAAEAAERARIRAMTDAERREAWEAGELGREHVRALETVSGPLLRAIAPEIDGCAVKGGTLETSQGATVPLRHAFRVFQFIALCRAEGKAWKPGGTWGPRALRVGHFTVDSVAPSGDFVAGCHSIKWGEVSRLASRLGVADCLATLPELMEPEAA